MSEKETPAEPPFRRPMDPAPVEGNPSEHPNEPEKEPEKEAEPPAKEPAKKR